MSPVLPMIQAALSSMLLHDSQLFPGFHSVVASNGGGYTWRGNQGVLASVIAFDPFVAASLPPFAIHLPYCRGLRRRQRGELRRCNLTRF